MELKSLVHQKIGGVAALCLAIFVALLTFFLSQAFIFASPGHDHGDAIEVGTSEYPVVTVFQPVSGQEIGQTLEASGEILPRQEGGIYPVREGVIESLYTDLGSYVYHGQLVGYLQPGIEQLELSTEILLEEGELQAKLDREDLLTAYEVSGAKIDEVTRQRLISIDTELSTLQNAVDAADSVQTAELAQIESSISALTTERALLINYTNSALLDLVDAMGATLYNATDIRNAIENTRRFQYRTELYGTSSTEVVRIATALKSLYATLRATASVDQMTLIQDFIALGTDARHLANRLNSSGNLSDDDVDDLRDDLAEAMDHLIEISNDFASIDSDLAKAQSERDKIYAESGQDITAILGEIDSLQAQKNELIAEALLGQADIQLDIQQSETRIDGLRSQIGVGRAIYAPISGYITKRHVSIGDSVGLDQPLFDIVDDSQKFVRFYASEEVLPFIGIGAEISFAPASSPLNRFTAVVARRSKSVDEVTKTVLVEAEVMDIETSDSILSHMNVRAFIPVVFDQEFVAVPIEAMELGGDSQTVWVINDALEAVRRDVTIDFVIDDTAYVSQGLTTDDWVIVKTPVPLKEGLEIDTTL